MFKVIRRERDEDATLAAVASMQDGGQVVDFDASLAVEAAAVGLEQGLAFADSVIYATALRHDALLWTQDAHFQGNHGVRYLAKQRPQ